MAVEPTHGRRRQSVLRFLVVLAVVAVGLVAVSRLTGGDAGCDPIPGVRPGVCLTPPEDRIAAPIDVALDLDGNEVSVADFAGQVLVVNFWAAWCGPCRAEQPVLNEAFALLAGEDIAFLGVAIQDSLVNQRAHEAEFAMPYASIFDQSNAYAARYGGVGARSIPTTIVLDRRGRVAVRLFGEIRDEVELAALTTRLAGEPA